MTSLSNVQKRVAKAGPALTAAPRKKAPAGGREKDAKDAKDPKDAKDEGTVEAAPV